MYLQEEVTRGGGCTSPPPPIHHHLGYSWENGLKHAGSGYGLLILPLSLLLSALACRAVVPPPSPRLHTPPPPLPYPFPARRGNWPGPDRLSPPYRHGLASFCSVGRVAHSARPVQLVVSPPKLQQDRPRAEGGLREREKLHSYIELRSVLIFPNPQSGNVVT